LRTRESVVSAECGSVMVKVKDSEREKDQKGIAIESERKERNLQLDDVCRFDVCQKKPAEGSRLHFAFDI